MSETMTVRRRVIGWSFVIAAVIGVAVMFLEALSIFLRGVMDDAGGPVTSLTTFEMSVLITGAALFVICSVTAMRLLRR